MYNILDDTLILHYHDVQSSSSSSSKLAIGLGVGGGVALLVAIVLCIVGIAYYRRCINFCILLLYLYSRHVARHSQREVWFAWGFTTVAWIVLELHPPVI